jgi:hypothetical protein
MVLRFLEELYLSAVLLITIHSFTPLGDESGKIENEKRKKSTKSLGVKEKTQRFKSR